MDKKIFVGPPDYEARVEALKMIMDERPQHKIDYIQIAEYTDLFTFAELEHVVNEAARQAVGERRRILMEDLIDAITKNPAVHTQEQIEAMRNQMI
jgi:SpoVK/Ycf46/Vps4 family AAA+-type ATPase